MRIELTNELKDIIVKGMEGLCNEAQYDFDLSAFRKNLDKWAKNKAHLYNAFSKSKDFNANELAIVKEIEIDREIDRDNANSFLLNWCNKCKCPYGLINALRAVCDHTNDSGIFEFNIERYLEDEFDFYRDNYGFGVLNYADRLYSYYYSEYALAFLCKQLKISSGMKSTKVLNKLFDAIKGLKIGKHTINEHYVKPVRELDENGDWTGNMVKRLNFNQFQAQLNDLLSPKTDKKKLVISINPLDYITQSRGNSWSSCHAFNRYWDERYSGCNKGATLTMMVDPSSVIAYIIDNDNESNLWSIPKHNRQSLFINEDHDYIMQNIFYPQQNDNLSKIVRQNLQELFNVDTDSWIHSTRINSSYVDVDTSEYKGFDDWTCSSKGCDVSYLKNNAEKEITLIIGRDAYCVDCDNEYIEENSSVCADHYGKIYCEYCDEWHYESDMRYIEYYDRYFCESELDNMYWCEDIDDYREYDDCWYDEYDGFYYSDDCEYEYVEDYGRVSRYNIENSGYFYYCDHCGYYYYEGYKTPHFDHDSCECYCDDCYEELELDFDEE